MWSTEQHHYQWPSVTRWRRLFSSNANLSIYTTEFTMPLDLSSSIIEMLWFVWREKPTHFMPVKYLDISELNTTVYRPAMQCLKCQSDIYKYMAQQIMQYDKAVPILIKHQWTVRNFLTRVPTPPGKSWFFVKFPVLENHFGPGICCYSDAIMRMWKRKYFCPHISSFDASFLQW